MTVITVDFDKEENTKIGIIKATKDFSSKEDAVKYMVRNFKERK